MSKHISEDGVHWKEVKEFQGIERVELPKAEQRKAIKDFFNEFGNHTVCMQHPGIASREKDQLITVEMLYQIFASRYSLETAHIKGETT